MFPPESLSQHNVTLYLSVHVAITKYQRLGGSDNRHLFFTDLETGKSKIKVLFDSGPGKGHFPGLQTAVFSLVPHMAESQ